MDKKDQDKHKKRKLEEIDAGLSKWVETRKKFCKKKDYTIVNSNVNVKTQRTQDSGEALKNKNKTGILVIDLTSDTEDNDAQSIAHQKTVKETNSNKSEKLTRDVDFSKIVNKSKASGIDLIKIGKNTKPVNDITQLKEDKSSKIQSRIQQIAYSDDSSDYDSNIKTMPKMEKKENRSTKTHDSKVDIKGSRKNTANLNNKSPTSCKSRTYNLHENKDLNRNSNKDNTDSSACVRKENMNLSSLQTKIKLKSSDDYLQKIFGDFASKEKCNDNILTNVKDSTNSRVCIKSVVIAPQAKNKADSSDDSLEKKLSDSIPTDKSINIKLTNVFSSPKRSITKEVETNLNTPEKFEIMNSSTLQVKSKDDSGDNFFQEKFSDLLPKPKDNALSNAASRIKKAIEKKNTHLIQNIELSKACANMNVEKANFEDEKTDSKKSPKLNACSSIPLVTISSTQKVFRFFWLDAYEDSYTNPGNVYLFGKVFEPASSQYISCCVTVSDVPRRIFVCPRIHGNGEQSLLENVYREFLEYASNKKHIAKFKCKPVEKNFAFGKEDLPQCSPCLEVRYSAIYPAVDSDYSGPEIRAIYGSSLTALELFLIEKKIQGPCWMDVNISPNNERINSWCKIDINCVGMENISVSDVHHKESDIPPITAAALTVQASLNDKRNTYEIASIGISSQENFQLDKEPSKLLFSHNYCLISQFNPWPKFASQAFAKKKRPKVILCESETDLLKQLLHLLQFLDPDFLVGYDIEFEFEILIRKIISLRIQDWSQIGKLKRMNPPRFKEKVYFNQVLCGRPLCDIRTCMNEFDLGVVNSDFPSLYSTVLNKEIDHYVEIKPEKCFEYYVSIYTMTILVESIMSKLTYTFEILTELNILSLAIQITKIAGNTLSRTFTYGFGTRIEFLLLHEFENKNYLIPDKKRETADVYDGRKKSAYAGGTVLSPKTGFYDTLVLLLDFNSLYPNIIQEFNICFTTLPGAAHLSANELYRVEPRNEQGILPTVLNRLVQSRAQIKKMMTSPNLSSDLRRQYNSRQLALKLIAVSMYGCLGAPHSRFYAQGLAALVALRGREIFKKTKILIESHNYEVIYGDTDSFMVNVKLTDYEQVMAAGTELQKQINKLFKKIKIKIDQVFKCLLLMKKKQYAGLTVHKLSDGKLEFKKEIKGLEIIKSDCCAIAAHTGNQVLDELLKDQPSDTRLANVFKILEKINKEVREGHVPLSLLEIRKTLSKDLDKYGNKNYPHLIVAERLNEMKPRQWKAGDVVSYVICQDNTARKSHERAYHIEELSMNSHIKIDVNYYLLHQIFPIILKICNPIKELDVEFITNSLGIAHLYQPKQTNEDRAVHVPVSLRDDRYKNCIPLIFNCKTCKKENEVKTCIIDTKTGWRPSLAICSNPHCNTPPWQYPHVIQNKLQLILRKCINLYYAGQIECSYPLCSNGQRRIELDLSDSFVKCYECLDGKRYRKYTEIDLYNQFIFFINIFTLDSTACQSYDLFTAQEIKDFYTNLREFMLDQVDCNAYSIINLNKLFCSYVKLNENDNLESDLV